MFRDHQRRLIFIALFVGGLVGCNPKTPISDIVEGRWYTAEQVDLGRMRFQIHCASCHGEFGEGMAEWRKVNANGNYPPPPLDGSAHAWHHPLLILERTVAEGGVPLGGVMPGFAETLSEEETRATIAYFQSFWPDDIYARWREIDSR